MMRIKKQSTYYLHKYLRPSITGRGWEVVIFLALFLFVSCKKEFVIPRASGRPYEVMVVMSDKDWQATQGRALFAVLDTDIPGLPQPERSFHISQVEPKRFDSILNIFRNIILVDINKQIYTKTSMKFTRDSKTHTTPPMSAKSRAPSAPKKAFSSGALIAVSCACLFCSIFILLFARKVRIFRFRGSL